MSAWNFEVNCGSNQPFEVVLTDAGTGDPVDLTGATAEWLINRQGAGENVIYYTQGAGLTLGGGAGTISGSLLPADTVAIAKGKNVVCEHQLFVTLSGGQAMLVQFGQITFLPKLSRPA